MRRSLGVLMIVLCGASLAAGQSAEQLGILQGPSVDSGPQGEARLRWVCERLDLNEPQTQQMEALIMVYEAELEEASQNTVALLRKMQEKLAEIDKAKADGDQQRVSTLQQELQMMAPETAARNNFFKSLVQVLTPEQKKRLPDLREQVKRASADAATPTDAASAAEARQQVAQNRTRQPDTRNRPDPNIQLRPSHVLMVMQMLELSVDQLRQLEEKMAEFRENLRSEPPRTYDDYSERTKRFINMVRPILTEEQASEFDQRIEPWLEAAPRPVEVQIQGMPERRPSVGMPRQRPAHPRRPGQVDPNPVP